MSLRRRARFALAAFAVSLVLPFASSRHAGVDDDAACGAAAATGHEAARIEDVRPGSAPDHCAVCHWLRAIGGAQPVERAARLQSPQPAAVVPGGSPVNPSDPSIDPHASRAPPVRRPA